MAEDREELKQTIDETKAVTEVRAPEETRIYNAPDEKENGRNADLSATSTHRWIEKDESLEEVKTRILARTDVERATRIAGESAEADDRATVIAGDRSTKVASDRNTKVAGKKTKVVSKVHTEDTDGADHPGRSFSEILNGITDRTKLIAGDLRRVKVSDKGKFARFLKIVGVFTLIFLIELGYFGFASHVKKMPGEIKKAQKELELTQKENAILEEEIEALGDYDSTEELKASWERLKDKVDKAAAGTYY